MKTLCSLLVIILPFAAFAHVQARDAIHQGDTVVVPLSGEISPSLFLFLRRVEKAAENAGADAIIFEMNTNCG
jgi:membrane-bound ClpP family serine protease